MRCSLACYSLPEQGTLSHEPQSMALQMHLTAQIQVAHFTRFSAPLVLLALIMPYLIREHILRLLLKVILISLLVSRAVSLDQLVYYTFNRLTL